MQQAEVAHALISILLGVPDAATALPHEPLTVSSQHDIVAALRVCDLPQHGLDHRHQ